MEDQHAVTDEAEVATAEVETMDEAAEAEPTNEAAPPPEGDPSLLEPRPQYWLGSPLTKTLSVPVQPKRLDELAHDLADQTLYVEKLMDEKKSVTKEYNNKIEDAQEACIKLAHVVESGEEEAPVPCRWRGDVGASLKELVRLDTEEVIETRPMTREEKEAIYDENQMELFDGEPLEKHGLELSEGENEFDTFVMSVYQQRNAVDTITLNFGFSEMMTEILSRTDRDYPGYWPKRVPSDGRILGVPYSVDESQEESYRFQMRKVVEPVVPADAEPDCEEPEGEEVVITETMSEEEKQDLLDRAAAGEWEKEPADA